MNKNQTLKRREQRKLKYLTIKNINDLEEIKQKIFEIQNKTNKIFNKNSPNINLRR